MLSCVWIENIAVFLVSMFQIFKLNAQIGIVQRYNNFMDIFIYADSKQSLSISNPPLVMLFEPHYFQQNK